MLADSIKLRQSLAVTAAIISPGPGVNVVLFSISFIFLAAPKPRTIAPAGRLAC
jgi:hypothetical protein